MARFYGEVGFGETVDKGASVWEEVVVEKKFYGDLLTFRRQRQEGDTVIDDVSITTTVSIMADDYVNAHEGDVLYVKLRGTRWKVTEVDPQRPRLNLRLGGKYNGPTPEVGSPPEDSVQ